MAGIANQQLSSKRQCGGCNACCTVMAVSALDKPAGVPCRHLVPITIRRKSLCDDPETAGACGIYDRRPRACAGFVCVWLRDTIGFLADPERPDRIGVVLTAGDRDAEGRPSIEVRELFRGSSRSEAARRMISRISEFVRVRVIAAAEPHPAIVARANDYLKGRRDYVRRSRRCRRSVSLGR